MNCLCHRIIKHLDSIHARHSGLSCFVRLPGPIISCDFRRPHISWKFFMEPLMLTRPQPDFNTYHNEPPQLDPNKFNRPLKSSRKRDELSAPTGLGSSSGANVLCVCSLLGLSSKKPVDLFKRDCDHTHITLVIPDLWQLVSIFYQHLLPAQQHSRQRQTS